MPTGPAYGDTFEDRKGGMPVFSIDPAVVAGFAVLWAAIVPTPGANSLMVTHVALTRGPAHLAWAIAGNMLGIALLALCALLGLAILLEAFPWARLAVNVVGGLYLVYFGARLVGRSRRPAGAAAPGAAPGGDTRLARTFALGLATALANAQAIVFITSIFAVAGVVKAGLATGMVCIAAMIALNAAYLGFLGWLFMRPTPRRLYLRFRRFLEGTIGIVFAFFGLRLILRELVRP